MKKTFLDYYTNILNIYTSNNILNNTLYTEETKDTKDDSAKQTDANVVYKLLEKSKTEALENINGITETIAKYAMQELTQAFNKNSEAFAPLYKRKEPESSSTETKETSTTATTESINTLFKDYYLSVINEGKTEDVTDGEYVLRVDENHNFKLVNTKDPDTKFAEKDYKKVNEWVLNNKDAWFKAVQKASNSGFVINDEIKQAAFAKIKIKDVDKSILEDTLNAIAATTHYDGLKSLLKAITKEDGFKTDDELKEIKILYIATLLYMLNNIKPSIEDKVKEAKDTKKIVKKKQANKQLEDLANAFKAECAAFQDKYKQEFYDIAEKCDGWGDNDVKISDNIQLFDYEGYLIDTLDPAKSFGKSQEIDGSKDFRTVCNFLTQTNKNNNNAPAHLDSIIIFFTYIKDEVRKTDHGVDGITAAIEDVINPANAILDKYQDFRLNTLLKYKLPNGEIGQEAKGYMNENGCSFLVAVKRLEDEKKGKI